MFQTNQAALFNFTDYSTPKSISNEIKLVWIPVHKGIEVNEKADQMAREAELYNVANVISVEDIIHKLRSYFTVNTKEDWLNYANKNPSHRPNEFLVQENQIKRDKGNLYPKIHYTEYTNTLKPLSKNSEQKCF